MLHAKELLLFLINELYMCLSTIIDKLQIIYHPDD